MWGTISSYCPFHTYPHRILVFWLVWKISCFLVRSETTESRKSVLSASCWKCKLVTHKPGLLQINNLSKTFWSYCGHNKRTLVSKKKKTSADVTFWGSGAESCSCVYLRIVNWQRQRGRCSFRTTNKRATSASFLPPFSYKKQEVLVKKRKTKSPTFLK
jgi:hypothetical protein